MTHFKSYRGVAAVVAAIALYATTVAGQPPLDLAKAKRQVAEQKAESDIKDVIKAADVQAQRNRAKAVEILKAAKADLQFASIGEATRTRLTNALDAKIAALEGRTFANPNNPGEKLDPKGAEAKAAQKETIEKSLAELKDVREGIKAVEKAQIAGNTADANAEIARLAKQYPHNPSVIALSDNDSMKNRLGNAMAHYKVQSDRWVANQRNIEKSSLPAIRDLELPANWKQISEMRLRNMTVQLTAKEKKIIEALDSPITVNFKDRPFEEALQDLSNLLDQPLLIDKKSILTDGFGVDLSKGTTLQAKGLSARTVLRSVLATQGLTFVVKDESIQIMLVEHARTQLSTRVYYLGDLVQGVGPFGDIRWGPFLNTQQTIDNVQVLMSTIQKSIDPLSWRENGGASSVTFHFPSMSIIVRASTEVHHSLGRTFGAGR